MRGPRREPNNIRKQGRLVPFPALLDEPHNQIHLIFHRKHASIDSNGIRGTFEGSDGTISVAMVALGQVISHMIERNILSTGDGFDKPALCPDIEIGIEEQL